MFRALTCPSSGGQIVLSQHFMFELLVEIISFVMEAIPLCDTVEV